MADLKRKATAVWRGDLKNGTGVVSGESGALKEASYTFRTRFENSPGTNPEELIAAAHSACFSMALSHTLAENGHTPQRVETTATIIFSPQKEGGFKVTRSHLEVKAQVPGMTPEQFQEMVRKGDQGCPISNLLRNGLEIEIDAVLL